MNKSPGRDKEVGESLIPLKWTLLSSVLEGLLLLHLLDLRVWKVTRARLNCRLRHESRNRVGVETPENIRNYHVSSLWLCGLALTCWCGHSVSAVGVIA